MPALLRGGSRLLDSALVTCSLQKKKTVHGPAHKCVGVGRQLETGVGRFAGAWLSPDPASQQATPKASLTWPCGGVRSEALHHTGRCLSGCTALLPDLLRGGIRLLDSALVTCSLQKKKSLLFGLEGEGAWGMLCLQGGRRKPPPGQRWNFAASLDMRPTPAG